MTATPTLTHYCDWDVPGKRLVRSICGLLIYRDEHANAPTCPECQLVLAARKKNAGPA